MHVPSRRRHITFVDPRCAAGQVHKIQCHSVPDLDSGVRSISFRQHLVTVGCGGGHLLFFDIRHAAWIDTSGLQCRAGKGWILRDQNYEYMYPEDTNHPAGSTPKHAIYAHAYNHSGRILFTGASTNGLRYQSCFGRADSSVCACFL